MKRVLLAEFDYNTGDPLAYLLTQNGYCVIQTYEPQDDTWVRSAGADFDAVIIGDHFAQLAPGGFDETLRNAVAKFDCPVLVFGDTKLKQTVESLGARWLDYKLDNSVVKAIAA